ncbi:MAG TPA: serpin family protein, partial [Paludibacter sp.]
PTIDPTTKLSIANSLWYRTGFPVKSDFLQINSDYFNAYVRELDFSQAWAKDTINNWCSMKTNKLIPSIIDNISSDMRMYLINAVYFKGIWRQRFETKNTVEANFTNELGTVAKVNMMSQTDIFAYAQDNYAKYLDMPYGNKAFSMTIILPNEEKSTSDVLNFLTPANWNNALSAMNKGEVMVKIPRFKVENKFKLNNVLKSMGINLAFLDLADFSKMSVKPLMISEVLHKTYVVVNEEGTEAAAVTSVGMMTNSMPVVKEFIVNKPFLYLIREKSTGVILFIGKMGNVEKY